MFDGAHEVICLVYIFPCPGRCLGIFIEQWDQASITLRHNFCRWEDYSLHFSAESFGTEDRLYSLGTCFLRRAICFLSWTGNLRRTRWEVWNGVLFDNSVRSVSREGYGMIHMSVLRKSWVAVCFASLYLSSHSSSFTRKGGPLITGGRK